MAPKLSIITINRNNASGLVKTIQSVINQIFTDLEYIIIDGASTDQSILEIQKYAQNITFWVSEPDAGIYNAMNKGIKKANGEYCLFINSGDYLFNNVVLNDVFSETRTSDLIYGNQLRVGPNKIRILTFPSELTFLYFYAEFLAHNCTFIKRTLFEKIGLYNEQYRIAADQELFMLAVCKYNCSTQFLNQIICVMADGGISNNPAFTNLVKEERNSIIEKHFPAFKSDYIQLYNYIYNSFYRRLKRKVKKTLIKLMNFRFS